MNTAQYLASLKKLGLTPYSKEAGAKLGIGASQLARYASGEHKPTKTIELLLLELLKNQRR